MDLFSNPACQASFTPGTQSILAIANAYAEQDFNTLLDRLSGLFRNTAIPQSPVNQTLLSWAYIAAMESGRFSDLIDMGIVYDIPAEQLPLELELLGAQFQQRALEAMLR